MYGVDLGNCVKQILEGKVAIGDVVKIYSPLDFSNERSVQAFVKECREHEWVGNPKRGEAILFELYIGGKIERYSPKAKGSPVVESNSPWVAMEQEIRWMTFK